MPTTLLLGGREGGRKEAYPAASTSNKGSSLQRSEGPAALGSAAVAT